LPGKRRSLCQPYFGLAWSLDLASTFKKPGDLSKRLSLFDTDFRSPVKALLSDIFFPANGLFNLFIRRRLLYQ
jgi:hypothetical protein